MDSRSSRNPTAARRRAALLFKGYTVKAFAEEHGFSASTVKAAIRGERHGPVSKIILDAIRSAKPSA
jgi:hypothetical protein